jgi:hypothetical protein
MEDSSFTLKDAKDLYENGKHRRYTLLFTVNGGAFAVAKLMTGEQPKPGVVLGKLTLTELSLGMVAFTLVMAWDIYEFGKKMRGILQNDYGPERKPVKDDFGTRGKVVLVLLTALMCAGWLLAGLG